ncbi:hypothetical protein [Thermodesulfobacterium commune]|jgi:hypothetical protein|uniref:Uncharacterized protein n=2 Tax=Thermodesulfobacterium commune TaxID=1741 RepID=A0A075WU28_9BACT|nr:hypothetical protein [Thermodesulfobacterium commune]AIH04475.1 hypothetical protein HL41_07080 [Thermodesulfobacterium commune DSM 2178]
MGFNKDRFLALNIEILKFMLNEAFQKRKHVKWDFLYREFSEYSKEEIDFSIRYLKDKGYLIDFEITAKGVDEVLKWI